MDAGSGVPVEGATVEVSGPRGVKVLSADDGVWRIPDLPAGRYTVRVEHLAYAPAERVVQIPGSPSASASPPGPSSWTPWW